MTLKDKSLLLKDICARLPYGVKLKSKNGEVATLVNPPTAIQDDCWNFKPYLRPMSSMTIYEKMEWFQMTQKYCNMSGFNELLGIADFTSESLDWLNAHHFDYRGLIEKGLALEAPEGMYKTE